MNLSQKKKREPDTPEKTSLFYKNKLDNDTGKVVE